MTKYLHSSLINNKTVAKRQQFISWYLCFSGMLCSTDWDLATNVLRQPISPNFKGQAVLLDWLTLEVGTDRLFQNAGTQLQRHTA
jgi:hypothetical protein